MLDVDFLMAKRTSFKNSIIYNYKTAVFKSEVYNKIKNIFEFRGFDCCEVDYFNFNTSSRSSSLFDKSLLFIIDLTKLIVGDKNYKKDFEILMLDILNHKIKNRFFILSREGELLSEFENKKEYQIFIKDCSYIVEADLFKSSANKVINYFMQEYDNIFFDLNRLKNKEIFIKAMLQGVEIVKYGLSDFHKLFVKSLINCIDGNFFDINTFNRMFLVGPQMDNFELSKAIYDFIGSFSDRAGDRLYHVICRLYFWNKHSTRLIIYSIIRIVREFSYINENLGSSEEYFLTLSKQKRYALDKFKSIPIKNLFKFSVNFASWEKRFNIGNFLTEFYDFINLLVG